MTVQEEQLIEFAKTISVLSTKVLEGSHLSTRAGGGVEFHSYTEGNEVRWIDWRRYAAIDKLLIRRFDRDEKTGFSILIDQSPSMTYGTKADWVRRFVGSVIFLADVRGDSWVLQPFDRMSVDAGYQCLIENRAGVDLSHLPSDLEFRAQDRIICVSDFMFDPDPLMKAMAEWREAGHRVHGVQVLDTRETQFDFSGVCQFEDLESSSKLLLDSSVAARKYKRALLELQEEWQNFLLAPSCFVCFLADRDLLSDQLMKFFERIGARAEAGV